MKTNAMHKKDTSERIFYKRSNVVDKKYMYLRFFSKLYKQINESII